MPTKKVVTKTVVKVAEKKVVKKAVAKKVVTKKTPVKTVSKVVSKVATKKTTKTSGKKLLRYADDTTSFWLTDGQVLNSLIALNNALDAMSADVYAYHVGPDRNDFSSWVSAVLCDDECAKELHKAKTAKSAKAVVLKHLKSYTL